MRGLALVASIGLALAIAGVACGPTSPSTIALPVSFEADEAWSGGQLDDTSIELRRAVGDGEVVATLALVEGQSAEATALAVQAIPGIIVEAMSESRMSERTGPNLEVENATDDRLEPLATASRAIVLEPGERMWLSLFDTAEGVLAIALTSDATTWDAALLAAEPFLESVRITTSP